MSRNVEETGSVSGDLYQERPRLGEQMPDTPSPARYGEHLIWWSGSWSMRAETAKRVLDHREL